MKISLNTIKSFNQRYKTTSDVAAIGIDKLVDKTGAQLGAVDEVISIGEKYQGIVIAKVVSCEKHPDADRLNVCTIDDGGNTPDVKRDANRYVQVVCGAPNVREGLTIAWLPPGATVPSSIGGDEEPFVLEARELRGVISNGMLASPKELAIGESHDGILEIDGDIKPGTDFAEAFGLAGDVLLEIENKMFTHRPDCFGFLGIARELAGIQGLPFKSPEWFVQSPVFPAVEADVLPLTITNELPDLVPRFTAIALSNVQVGPSPVWLQVELAKIGQNSINNIVDYTNYFMLQTGQPLHAFDYDKVKALSDGDSANIVIRNPRPSESLTLLNGTELKPRPEAIMIATDKQLIGVAGVKGGLGTGIDENTKNIILECANFDMYSIRRTSMAHGLFTDAVTRFNKGQSPLQNLAVLAKIVDEIRQYADGKVASELIDNNHLDEAMQKRGSLFMPIKLSAEFINSRLGSELSAEEIKTLLTNVEFGVEVSGDEITVTSPFWRTDVELREDVVEEIGRLHGYDQLPLDLPKRDLTPTIRNAALDLKAVVRDTLARSGGNEVLTYSFVHGDLLTRAGQDPARAYQVSNALSPDLQYYRLSLTPSLLDKVHANIKSGYKEFALFEIGKAHVVDREEDNLPIEFERVAMVFAADKKSPAAKSGAPYYQARTYLMAVLDKLGLSERVSFEPLEKKADDTSTSFYADGRASTLVVDGQIIGRIGEYKASVLAAFKLPAFCAGFELGLEPLSKLQEPKGYIALPRFPKVSQDITLRVATDLPYQELFDFARNELQDLQPDNTLPRLTPVDIYQGDDKAGKNITLRLDISSYERTLTDTEVNKLLDSVAAAAKSKLSAERI
ncbi:MAG: phenylalanine--tRNA ligase subunit beta [Patescibacteria group bacterium]